MILSLDDIDQHLSLQQISMKQHDLITPAGGIQIKDILYKASSSVLKPPSLSLYKFHSTTTFKAVVVLAIAALLLASTGDQSSPLASRAISPPDRRSVFGFSIQRRTLWVLMMHACMQATQQRQRGRRTMASTRRRRAPRALEKERPAATGAATSATLREATPTTSAAAVLDYDLRKLRPETNLASE